MALAHKLCIKDRQPLHKEVTIVDYLLLYHKTWPTQEDASVITDMIKTRMYATEGKQVFGFDKYLGILAKDHERFRRASVGFIEYQLNINIPLSSQSACHHIMKTKQGTA